MLINYLKLAIRLLIRNPFFTFINVMGLTIGFTTFFTLWQYSSSELRTDQQYKDFDRIGRIGFEWIWANGEHLIFSASKASIPPRLKQDFPEVESYVRISEQAGFMQNDLHEGHRTRVFITSESNGDKRIFKETKLAYADRNIFQFFGIPLSSGDAETVLTGVNFVALSESTARKYFADQDPVGKQLTLNDSITLNVTGIYEDMPHNSRLNYDMIISNEGLLTKWNNVYWGGTQSFVKLRGSSIREFEKKLRAHTAKYWDHIINTCNDCRVIPFVQPLKDVAFSQGFIADEAFHQKSRPLLITLGLVAIVVLAMAWINYMNLTLSKISGRMKEFAARRANGARAVDLVFQFLIEATLTNTLAVGLSFTAFQLIRTPLEIYFDIHVGELLSLDTEVWLVLWLVIAIGILVTGLYPAFVCVQKQPHNLLAAKTNSSNPVSTFLTTFQFTTAIVLILWAFIIYSQLNHILHKDTGYKREGVVVIDGPINREDNYQRSLETLVAEWKSLPGVHNVTLSSYQIGEPGNKPGNIWRQGSRSSSSGTEYNAVDENFIPTFGLKLIAGRNFIANDRQDVVIISRPHVKALGYDNPEDVIGQKLTMETGDWGITKDAEVIGVIEDYRRFPFFNLSNSNSIYAAGGVGVFLTYKNTLFPELTSEKIAAEITMENIDRTIASMRSKFTSLFPGNVFELQFLDDSINQVYAYEKITRNQVLMFTLLAIGIACMGLIGMMNQKIIEKTKEVGIRKILGASLAQIGNVLIRPTLIQLAIASFVGIPVAWFLSGQYVQKYAEQISLAWWYFLMPIVILLTIMMTSVSTLLWRAVQTNPVESLRNE